jgi:DNA repair protein RecN (Recombination protein N)
VAAFGHRHLVVTKDVDGETGSTGVSELDDAARAGELARMLAGLPESELGRAHAGELLDLAAHDRAALRR